MLGITPCEASADRPGFQHVRMQIAAEISDHQKQQPDRGEPNDEERDRLSLLDPVEPCQKRPAPSGRRGVRTCRHRREKSQIHEETAQATVDAATSAVQQKF